MTGQEEQSQIEAKRVGKHAAEETERLSKKQTRRKGNIDREQTIEKDLKARYAKQSEKRVAEEHDRLVKDQARRKAYLAREAMAEAQKARKLNGKK
ncbi:hypothetical protein ACFLVR_05220 [Chloroflexota bacterium]